MKYKIAVCDDNIVDQKYVSRFLMEWAEDTNHIIDIHTFVSAEQFLFEYADDKDFQVLILDIEMGEMNGVELARKLREETHDLQIVFVTGFPDFIAEGYEVDAIHYLMKPIQKDKFFGAMDKAVSHLNQSEKYLVLQNNGEMSRIAASSIFYVEVFSHSCVLHIKDENLEYKIPISKLEAELGDNFIRVHRSYLVNLEHISQITKTEIKLENAISVPLSRRKYNEVNMAFISFFGGRLGLK